MTYRFVGANFDQMHMNDNLAWVADHPDAEIVGVCDEDPSTSTGSLEDAVETHDLPDSAVFDDLDDCIDATDSDVVIGCPMNAEHASFVERVAPHDVHVAIEKPMADSLDGADRMLDAIAGTGNLLVVNWPVAWDPVEHEVRRLVREGTIGDVVEVQYYGGNAGAPPADSWFYDADAGGGALLDYLSYGATFSTWFRGGELPESVTAETHTPDGMEVEVQSSTIARFEDGLSTLQTSWRMPTNPWEIEPQPAKGYVLVGTEGSISTVERGVPVRVQTDEEPEGYAVEPDPVPERFRNLVHYVIDRIEIGKMPEGPCDPEFCREAQRILETAKRSAEAGKRLELVD